MNNIKDNNKNNKDFHISIKNIFNFSNKRLIMKN